MRDIVKKDILEVMEQSLAALEAEDHHALSELSNHVIHDASIFQDDDSVTAAVLIYALSKMAQRCCDEKISFTHIIDFVQQAHDALAEGKEDSYRDMVRRIIAEIQKLDGRLKLYIEEVLDKARIKKASSMHEHGISMARTAELLGISQWELQNYIGKTMISEQHMGVSAPERLKRAREWFK